MNLKNKFGFDDSLDVVGVHLVGGLVGCLLIGFFATTAVNSAGAQGFFNGGGWALLGKQAFGSGAVAVYSFVVTLLLGMAIDKTIGFRVTADEEREGIDVVEHGEIAYARQVVVPDVADNPVEHAEQSMFHHAD